MKKLFTFLIVSSLLTVGSFANAHTDLAQSVPGDGAVANEAPKEVELHFTEAVRLLKFSITNGSGAEVQVEFSPSADMADTFAIALPSLTEDSYTVHWSAMSDDDHIVEKTFAFTVDADAHEVEGTAAHAESGHSH